MPEHITIGRLASATGIKVETVRYYEKAGLIAAPSRTTGNYRSYREEDVARLRFIRRTRDLGFPLVEIRRMLDLAAQRDRDCSSVDALASTHLVEVDRKIADLQALRRELAAVISSCAGGTVAQCRILDAFAATPPEAPARTGRVIAVALRLWQLGAFGAPVQSISFG